jgi:hypothetical protein
VTIVTGGSSAAGRAASGIQKATGDRPNSAQLLRDLAERLRGERLRHYLHRLSHHERVDIPEGPCC